MEPQTESTINQDAANVLRMPLYRARPRSGVVSRANLDGLTRRVLHLSELQKRIQANLQECKRMRKETEAEQNFLLEQLTLGAKLI